MSIIKKLRALKRHRYLKSLEPKNCHHPEFYEMFGAGAWAGVCARCGAYIVFNAIWRDWQVECEDARKIYPEAKNLDVERWKVLKVEKGSET
jgi:hypothetical protein